MKDTFFKRFNWCRKRMLLLLLAWVDVCCVQAALTFDTHWYYQGESTLTDVSTDHYVTFVSNGFQGEITFSGDFTFLDVSESSYFNSDNKKKIWTKSQFSGDFYVYYNEETGTLSVVDGSCAGMIDADSKTVCKGENVKLTIVDASLAKYTVEWGVVASSDTTWLDSYNNVASFTYTIDSYKPVVFCSKITSIATGEQTVHSISVSPSLAKCGYTLTSDASSICLGESLTLTTNYSKGTTYTWKDDKGNNYGSTTEPTITLAPRESGTFSISAYVEDLLVASTSVTVKTMESCGYHVTAAHPLICLGGADTLKTDYTASSYTWKTSDNVTVGVTNVPEFVATPTEKTTYKVYGDGFYIGQVTVDVRECTFFIGTRYPINSCVQDINILVASGTAVLEDLDKQVFQWEASYDGIDWVKLPSKSYLLSVNVDTTRYYRLTYNGSVETLYYPKPDCHSTQYCNGLETKTLFYETFGFFMADNVYFNNFNLYTDKVEVNHKTSVYTSDDDLIGSASDYSLDNDYYKARANNRELINWGTIKEDPIVGATMKIDHTTKSVLPIRDYIAPDPNGYVVTPSNIIDAEDANASNQFVGTDGHLFLTENPMLRRYDLQGWLKRPEMRLQDGYYAIVMNPDSCDQIKDEDKDNFITSGDATGNKNGAMLFVNAGLTDKSKAAIYAQKVSMTCEADRFNFSMSVRNAVVDPSQNPVNLSIYLLHDFDEVSKIKDQIPAANVVTSFETGDVAASEVDWTKFDKYVELDEKIKDLWVVIYNNGQSGDGNDILLDDIIFSVCIPKASLVATMDGQTFTKEVVSCSGDEITLVASQESAYINDPVYIFQYQKVDSTVTPFDTTWVDVREYSEGSAALKQNTADINTSEPSYWGDVTYRVVIGDNYESARLVADSKETEISECEFTFHIATAHIKVRNTFGGKMAPRDSVAFCNILGTVVEVPGERLLTMKNHPWKMSWLTQDSTVLFEQDVVGVSKDTLTLTVIADSTFSVKNSLGSVLGTFTFNQMDSVIFRAEDEGGCQFFQNIVLHPKMNLNITPSAEQIVDCNTVTLKVTRNYSEPSLVFDWSAVPGNVTVINDTTQMFEPDGLAGMSAISGMVKVTPVNVDDKYCFLQDQIEVPYTIHNGHYKMKITPSKDPVCVSSDDDSKKLTVLTLTANVDATGMTEGEAAKIDAKITSYKWHVEFSTVKSLDTVTTSNVLAFTNEDLWDAENSHILADEIKSYVVTTTTDVCETITHAADESEITIEVREGAFTLKLSADPSVCLSEKTKDSLRIVITPSTALLSISSIQLSNNGVLMQSISSLKDTMDFVFDNAAYPNIFKAGSTSNYMVSVYDETCKSDNISNVVTVKYNSYDWKFNSPDSCLTVSDNLFNVVATIDSTAAVNHITSYDWSLNGVPFANDGFSYSYSVPNSSTLTFKLVTSDGICPDVEHEFTTNVGIKYAMSLTSSQNKICSTESATVTSVITPASSRDYIKGYKWYAVDGNGGETLIKDGTPKDSVLELKATNFPDLFTAGGSFSIYAVASDEICDDVQSTNTLDFDVNTPFTIALSKDFDKLCYKKGDVVELKATVTPADAANHIQNYVWKRSSDQGVLTQTTTAPVLRISDLADWMSPNDTITFSVSVEDGICVKSSDEVIDHSTGAINTPFAVSLALDKQFACSVNDQVFMSGTNTGASNEHVSYDYSFISLLNGEYETLANPYNQKFLIDYPSNYEGLTPGSVIGYTLVVNDGNICGPVSSDMQIVTVQTPFKVHVEVVKEVVCQNDFDVASVVSFTPAEAAQFVKLYTWQELESGSVLGVVNDNLVVPTQTVGYHTFFANISDGICYGTDYFPTLQSDSVTVKVKAPLSVSLDGSISSYCSDGSTPPLVLTASVSSGEPLIYQLYYDNSQLYGTIESTEMTHQWVLEPTDDMKNFSVLVADGVCSEQFANTIVSVDVHHPIEFKTTIPEEDYKICLGEIVHFSTEIISDKPLIFTWYGLAADTANVGLSSPTLYLEDAPQVVGPVEYTIVASDGVCPSVSQKVGPVEVFITPIVNLLTSNDEVVIGSTIDLTAFVAQGKPILYSWSKEGQTLGTTEINELPGVTPTSSSVYTVYVSDGVCPITSSSVEVGVLVPTAFTPHYKDGYNDVFMKGFDVVIFDRYGMKVFEGNDGWDGKKGAVMADPGVYYCYIVMKDGKIYKGTVELVKIDK